MNTTAPTLYGISLNSPRIFGIRHIDGLTFSQRRALRDTDNNGVCYTCGGYSPARDAGRII